MRDGVKLGRRETKVVECRSGWQSELIFHVDGEKSTGQVRDLKTENMTIAYIWISGLKDATEVDRRVVVPTNNSEKK